MSSLLRPAGPLPPRVYWLRRLVAVALVILVVLVLSWAWGLIGGSGGGSNAGPSTSTKQQTSSSAPATSTSHSSSSPKPSKTSSHSPSHSSSPTKSSSGKPSSSTSTSSSSPSAKPCTGKSLAVTVSTDVKSYPSDVQPRLAMSVRNSGSLACTRDVGQAALELRISTTAGVVVWSSDHCAPGGPHEVVTLQPNQVFRTAVVWSRTTSKVGCPTGQPKASSGSYVLTGRDLAITSAGAKFDLL